MIASRRIHRDSVGPTLTLAGFLILTALGGWILAAGDTSSSPDRLGGVWRVTEDGNWTGTWTRRGDSFTFDAEWFQGSHRVTGVLTMAVQGRTVTIRSRQQTNGNDVDYEGTLSPDGRSIQGTLRVLGRSDVSNWRAVIEARPSSQDLLGSVWRVAEDGGWTGTWTRRGDSFTFDAEWFQGSRRVTGVLTMAVRGRAVTIQSRQQTNGNDVDYEGTLSPDGRSIQGTLRVLGRSGVSNWQATIEAPPARDLLGSVWRVAEDGGWTGTWTRRGGSVTFDAEWFQGSHRVTGVLTMAVRGRAVTIQSRQQTNGNDVDYEGTLSPDGRTVRGTLRVLGRSGVSNWHATID